MADGALHLGDEASKGINWRSPQDVEKERMNDEVDAMIKRRKWNFEDRMERIKHNHRKPYGRHTT
jgi:hypothetical protein